MDHSAPGRRRPPGAQPTSKPPVRIARDRGLQKETARRPTPGKIREAKDSSEIIRVPKRVEAIAAERPSTERRSTDDDPNARHFTVANVGRNGAVYLKPSRFQVPVNQTPATPPGTSDGKEEISMDWATRRPSAMSGTWTPRGPAPRGSALNATTPVPPLSMANGHDRRGTRSHSFSTLDTSGRPTFDSNDFQILVNGRDTGRPKSSVDLSDGILDLRIPHYRLGTPRFSDRGTAYLHNSMYTSNSEGMRSSVFSSAEYDKLFPAPPGKEHGGRSRESSSPYLHPAHAMHSLTPSRTPPTPQSNSPVGDINPSVYDKVEARLNDATLVRYSPTTGRITAATPARLIAQITSPLFLDYELLADFFLTFRNFLSPSDLLEYMLARMKWALSNDSDAGRIVRVRTFVALRHWILNYFADDFIPVFELRQRFCTLVNQLTLSLLRRADKGGTDVNVLGELKKCWRRTCAMYWPVSNALDTSPEADILPGRVAASPGFEASSTSLPLSVQARESQLDFRRSSVIRLPPEIEKDAQVSFAQPASPEAQTPNQHARTASIPTSPMSEDSLTVLSCSVPFLRNMMQGKEKPQRPVELQRNPHLDKSDRPTNGHKRSGSFSDALRDKRPPLPSAQPDGMDLRSLQSLTFTGGLVRGLLLQPSPSTVELLIPLSPPLDIQTHRSSGTSDSYFQEQQLQSVGMKRLVGDVRRALSSRRPRESPASSHRSTNSSDSRSSGNIGASAQAASWQQLSGPPRVDMLAERVATAYKEVFDGMDLQQSGQQEARPRADRESDAMMKEVEMEPSSPPRDMRRLDSHVTTGSRSIVIVDDTGMPEVPKKFGALPSVSSWSSGMAPDALFRSPQQAFDEWQGAKSEYRSGSATAVASEGLRQASGDPQMHDLLTVPGGWQEDTTDGEIPVGYTPARKSSSVNPSAFELQPVRHQLRRRPGGDLKATDHVHDLEPAPRHHHGDSYSTITHSMDSDNPPNELTGTHFSGQGYNGWQGIDDFAQRNTQPTSLLPTHSSQPNMRASFEQQVSHLKQLPEGQQQDEEGGIEDALAKLEGKPSNMTMRDSAGPASAVPQTQSRQGPRSSSVQFARVSAQGKHTDSADGSQLLSPTTDRQGASIYRYSGSEAESEEVMGRPVLRALNPDSPTTATSDGCAIESVDFADDPAQHTAYGRRYGEAERPSEDERSGLPHLGTPQGSFLLDDNESLSDISTEIADQSGDESLGVRSFFFDDTPADEFVPTFASYRPPPTPPPTIGPSTNVSSTSEPSPMMAPPRVPDKKTLKEAQSAPKLLPSNKQDPRFRQSAAELRRVHTAPSQKQVAHLPFVLAFESDVVAEQLTIIEKDALDEVEWKDLVGLSWKQTPPTIRNWVDFLQHESNGIDIVIARFNLVVKWVVSECLLTEAPSERARCITKYIHIAASCHRLRNYASMYQITLALLSADMARLHQTWALVAQAEKAVLERLEKLCQPVRNFHNLRSEMEEASAEAGCIPFIGLYTHDLMFNAQKPGHIDPMPPGKEKLVNFERYQTAATIVKSLLRLIEASSKYIFRPHPEVLSRCLWLAALEDGEITTRSKTLES
ncbi:Guanine nucleotide exchange factor lte1 [Saxophila tyrrhenica]|uniref:Guanine nucleotide exchange factor lte1 n=1 Tax=Saxophila tyrrhenica TaxID=1690608 RepID=A0AAV9P7N7_9PEZI|nr:Guanine nucleotide exchange factor lte1 [Saxophila tyrrhenica]